MDVDNGDEEDDEDGEEGDDGEEVIKPKNNKRAKKKISPEDAFDGDDGEDEDEILWTGKESDILKYHPEVVLPD